MNAPSTQTEGPIRVLVVDDEADMVASLRDVLSEFGYAVETASSGPEALERAREWPPDCILMDIRMPGMNGVETFREIKRLCPECFVLFMTAYSASHLVDEALAEGAIEVLPKPLDLERILTLIDGLARSTPVLVVDDDPDFRDSLGDALKAQGLDVRLASELDTAIRLFEQEPRRVVLLDLRLGPRSGLDGLVLVKELNPRAIVILMSGYRELAQEMDRGRGLSAHACFWKPFDIGDLIRTLQQAVERRRRHLHDRS